MCRNYQCLQQFCDSDMTNFDFRRRRNSSIIIPNWGGLRLKAILASEWSQLKKKYKEIQKQNMRKLKQSLKVTQQRH